MNKLKNKMYESYFADHYSFLDDKQGSSEALMNSTHGKQYVDFLGNDTKISILDLGSGTGSLVSGLQNYGFENVTGVDISSDNVQFATENGLEILESDINVFLSKSFEEGRSYDVIFLLDVLEHLDNSEIYETLENVHRCLKPGGKFFVKTINAESMVGGLGRYMDITHERSFTSHSLRQLLKVFHFENIKIINQIINKPNSLKTTLRSYIRRIFYFFIYRILESREYPECIDLDIVIVSEKS